MTNVATRLFTLLMLLQRQPNQKAASLVSELWGRLYQDAAQAALAKLEHVLPNDQRQEVAWARRALVVSGLHRTDADALLPNLESLRAAVRQQRRVSMAYLGSGQSEPTRRQVDPYALVHRWGWWYVAGFCHLRQGVRLFRVDRIQNLEMLEAAFQGADVARSQSLSWSSTQDQPDGGLVVTFPSYDMEYAAATALAYGSLVQVLEPDSLCRLVAERARAVAGLYS
jgi:predicted DNA-binding transcriptional regulator YafY